MVFLKNALLLDFSKNTLKIFCNDSFASRHISPPGVDNNCILGFTSSTSCASTSSNLLPDTAPSPLKEC